MLMIRGYFARLNVVYFMRSKDEVTNHSSQNLLDYGFTDMPSPVDVLRTDDAT